MMVFRDKNQKSFLEINSILIPLFLILVKRSIRLMKVIDKLNEADKDKLMDILNVIAKQVLDEDFVNYVESSCERLNEDDTN